MILFLIFNTVMKFTLNYNFIENKRLHQSLLRIGNISVYTVCKYRLDTAFGNAAIYSNVSYQFMLLFEARVVRVYNPLRVGLCRHNRPALSNFESM